MSIWEFAEFNVTEGMEDAFAEAVLSKENLDIWRNAEGCLGMQLHRSVDVPGRFMLMLQWETVAHHREIFPKTEGCRRLVASIEPYYSERLRVFHAETLPGGFLPA